MSGQPNFGPTVVRPDARGFLVFVVFAALGPPLVGLIIFLVGFAMATSKVQQMAHARSLFEFATLVMAISYWVGGLQAIVVGVVAGIAQSRARSHLVPLVPVLLACLVAGAGFMVVVYLRSVQPPLLFTTAAFVGLHLVAGLLCWFLSNAILWPFRNRNGKASIPA
jgi:hypothetical protein